jgi:creatinine amidohydrolase
MKQVLSIAIAVALGASSAAAQELPSRWDELTASDWPQALERSATTCILPIGVLEKHGPHAPIGSDLIHAREWSRARREARVRGRVPRLLLRPDQRGAPPAGTFALPPRVVWDCSSDGRRDRRATGSRRS